MDNSLDDFIILKIDSLLARGTLLSLVDIEVAKGEVEVLDTSCASELDIIIGNYKLKKWDTSKIALEGTESFIMKIGERLLQEGLVAADECFDLRSILATLAGSRGYERFSTSKLFTEELQDYELNILVSWIYAVSILQFSSTSVLRLGVKAIAGEYRKSTDMKLAVKDIVEAYQLEHTFRGERLINIDAVIVPSWYWIQKLKENRKKSYNYILKKKV